MVSRFVRVAALLALLTVLGLPARAADDPPGPAHHAVVQKKVGFYAVYLPPGYDAEENREVRWPVCVLLNDAGETEADAAAFAETLGRRGVIYVAPRAAHEALFVRRGGGGGFGWSVWPRYPESWGPIGSEGFPREEIERLKVERLFTDFVADCLADVRERYRVEDRRAVVLGGGEGAMLAHLFAIHRPELVREYFAYAGWYRPTIQDDVAAVTLKKHGVRPVLAHCNGDPRVEARETRDLSSYLTEHGVDHDALIFPGGSHSWTTRATRAAQEFVASRCRGEELPPLRGELVVTAVAPGSPAADLGLLPGDVITSYNGRPLANRDDLVAAMASVVTGQDEVPVTWTRDDRERETTARPGPLGAMLVDR